MKKKFLFVILIIGICFSLAAEGYPEQQFLLEGFPKLQNSYKRGPERPSSSSSQTTSAPEYNKITTAVTANNNSTRTKLGTSEIESEITNLSRLYKYIDQNFIYDIDYEAVYEAMATAMFDALDDEYSMFVKTEETDDYDLSMTRKYAGAGFVFSKYNPEYQEKDDPETLYCLLSQIYPNTPASKVGLKSGDLITHIDGESVINLTSNECASKIKGDEGTKVVLTILRNDSSFDVTITRAIISIPELSYCMVTDNIGYISLLQFVSESTTNVTNAIKDLLSQGMTKLILDLRENPGGMVDSSLEIADLFLSSGKVLMRTNYVTTSEVHYSSKNQLLDDSYEMVVLINNGSASASEILTGALKDNNRATIVGETTFGKGVSQVSASWGKNEFKLTTASFNTPNNDVINKVGISPDVEVAYPTLSEDEFDEYERISKENLIEDYVKQNPEYTKANVENFATTHPDVKINSDYLNLLVSYEYISQMDAEDQPIVDTWFDPQVLKAIELLSK